MSSNIKIPKFCQYCGQAFVAQTTTTWYCSKTCNSQHYKQIKREEKIQSTLKEQIKSVTSANSEKLKSLKNLPIQTGNFIHLRDKEKLKGSFFEFFDAFTKKKKASLGNYGN